LAEAQIWRTPAITNSLSNRTPRKKSSGQGNASPAAAAESPAARRQRIAQIRRQIKQGTYETKKKLEVALRRLLKDLNTHRDN